MYKNNSIAIYSGNDVQEFYIGGYKVIIKGKPFLPNSINGLETWEKELSNILYTHIAGGNLTLNEFLKNTSGLFSLIIVGENEIYLATDIIRSHTLFYGFKENKLFITDDPDRFQNEYGNFELNHDLLEEFFTVGLVLGNRTVYENVFCLQAGENVAILYGRITSERYFLFRPSHDSLNLENFADFTNALDKKLLSTFSRMVEQNSTVNNWVVPLSGGHDSRLIVNYLHRLGVRNVICYSYGTINNEQSKLSKKIAEALGYKWYFVHYSEEKWLNLHNEGVFDDYIAFASRGLSTPHLQDFLAVYELKTRNIVEANDIFLPGHSSVTARFNKESYKLNNIEEAAMQAYNYDTMVINKSPINKKALETIRTICEKYILKPNYVRAFINWQERQAKFTVNSVRVYEFFGFKYLLPFWDKSFVDFWLKYPANKWEGRQVLFNAEVNGLLIEQLIKIPFAGGNSNPVKTLFRFNFKRILSPQLIDRLLQMTHRKVVLNEGLNQIYTLKATSVRKLLEPIDYFPQRIQSYFQYSLKRFPYQMDPNLLTIFYTTKKFIKKSRRN